MVAEKESRPEVGRGGKRTKDKQKVEDEEKYWRLC